MAMRLISANFDTVRYFADPYGREPVAGDDPALDVLYERNIRAISAINRQRGVTTIWVGQLLNREPAPWATAAMAGCRWCVTATSGRCSRS